MKSLVGVTKCSASDWFNAFVYLLDSLMSSWCLEIVLKIYSKFYSNLPASLFLLKNEYCRIPFKMDSSGKYPSEGISNNSSVYYSYLLQRKTVVRNSCGTNKFIKNYITSFKLSNIVMTMFLLFLMKILSLPSLSSLRNGNLQKSLIVDNKESGRIFFWLS